MDEDEKLLNKKMVLAINKLVIEMSGGEPFRGSSNMRPGASLAFIDWIKTNNVFGKRIFSSKFHKAAGYLYYILKDHSFIDGNKRTALAAAVTYLEWNETLFEPTDDNDVYEKIRGFAHQEATPDVLIPRIAYWLRRVCLD